MRISGRVVLSSAERVQRLPAPFLSELRDLQAALGRRGRDVVDLGRYSIKMPLSGEVTASTTSSAQIKSVFAEYLRSEHGVEIDPSREMLILPGARVALLILAAYLADEDTLFHLPDPGYEAYRVPALMFGAKITTYPLFQRTDYLPNPESLKERPGKTSRVMVINSPHNPTGAVCDGAFYERLRKAAATANLLVVADSSYALSSAGNFRPVLFCENSRRLRVGLEVFSFSTGLCAPEIKLTALIGKKALIQPLATLAKLLSLEPSQATINSAAGYFSSTKVLGEHINRCREEIGRRTAIIVDALKSEGIEYYPVCHSGFVWIKLRHRRVSLSFARSLLRMRGIMVAPGSAFGEQGEGWIRVSANVGGDTLAKAMEVIVRHYQPIRSQIKRIRHE